MTVSFYNEHGTMGGVDFHVDPNLRIPMPFSVTLAFCHPTYMPTKKSDNVTTDGVKAFKNGMDFYLVPHCYPGGVMEPQCTILSGSKAWMAVHSVTVNGEKAATCVTGPMSSNVNCNDPMDSPYANVVTNLNSVVTQPTPGDYYGSWMGAWADILLSLGVGALGERVSKRVPEKWRDAAENAIKQVWRRAPDALPILDAPGRVSDEVQQQVDSALK